MNPVEEFIFEKSAMSPEVKSALTMGAIAAGTTAATAVGTAQLQAGIQSAHDAVSRSIAFKKMMRDNPELQKMDGKKARRYFNTLYNTAPELAKDPFASASWVRRVEDYDYVDPQSLNTLAQTGAKLRERRMQSMVPAFQLAQTGVQSGMGEYSRLQNQAFDLSRDEAKRKLENRKEIIKALGGVGSSLIKNVGSNQQRYEDQMFQAKLDAKKREEDQQFQLMREARENRRRQWEVEKGPGPYPGGSGVKDPFEYIGPTVKQPGADFPTAGGGRQSLMDALKKKFGR